MTIINNTISKAEISEMPRVVFSEHIEVIDTIEKAEKAIESLRKESIIGFDTETRPSFRKGVMNKIALLQLSTQNVAYLFRLNKIGVPQCVTDFLADSSVIKVGLSIKDDFCSLNRSADVHPCGFIELQDYVHKLGIEEQGLQKIFALLFGKRISKNQQLSNWEIDSLTSSQCQYASIDAWACLQIYNYLEDLKNNGDFNVVKRYAEESLVKEG